MQVGRFVSALEELNQLDNTVFVYLLGDNGASGDGGLDEAKAPERQSNQYFEMCGNRGIYRRGWTAVTRHGVPWDMVPTRQGPFTDDEQAPGPAARRPHGPHRRITRAQ